MEHFQGIYEEGVHLWWIVTGGIYAMGWVWLLYAAGANYVLEPETRKERDALFPWFCKDKYNEVEFLEIALSLLVGLFLVFIGGLLWPAFSTGLAIWGVLFCLRGGRRLKVAFEKHTHAAKDGKVVT